MGDEQHVLFGTWPTAPHVEMIELMELMVVNMRKMSISMPFVTGPLPGTSGSRVSSMMVKPVPGGARHDVAAGPSRTAIAEVVLA